MEVVEEEELELRFNRGTAMSRSRLNLPNKEVPFDPAPARLVSSPSSLSYTDSDDDSLWNNRIRSEVSSIELRADYETDPMDLLTLGARAPGTSGNIEGTLKELDQSASDVSTRHSLITFGM